MRDQLKRILNHLDLNQFLFLSIFVPLCSLAPLLYRWWDEFYKHRNLERPDYENAAWKDLWMTFIFVPLIAYCKYLFKNAFHNFFYKNLSKKYQGEALELKMHKSSKNAFKVFYFGVISIFGYYVYTDTNYHSPMMYGSGNLLQIMSDWPYMQVPHYLKVYYMIGVSYHLEDSIHHLFYPAQNDFFEMLLHHYITLLLIVGSYMTNLWNFGISVMIQMDSWDWLGGLIKASMDFAPTWFVLSNYIVMVYYWIYFRIYAFSVDILINGGLTSRYASEGHYAHHSSLIILWLGLLLLNVYWVILFFRMGWRFIRKGEVKDIQNPVEDTKIKLKTKKK